LAFVDIGLLMDVSRCRNAHAEKRNNEQQTQDVFACHPFWRSVHHADPRFP
jgi:hypothetical protein